MKIWTGIFINHLGKFCFIGLLDSKSYPADVHMKVYLHINCRKTRHTQTHTHTHFVNISFIHSPARTHKDSLIEIL